VLGGAWFLAASEGYASTSRLDEALPYLVAGLIQLVRPVMVAAVHGLYEDLRAAA
jgi:hypothetical protein